MNQKEFMKWYRLTAEVNPILKKFRTEIIDIPSLFIMGEQDYMFLPSIKKLIYLKDQQANLVVIPNCGHVVNIENANVFNSQSILFLSSTK